MNKDYLLKCKCGHILIQHKYSNALMRYCDCVECNKSKNKEDHCYEFRIKK